MRKLLLYAAVAFWLIAAAADALAGGVRYPCDRPLVFEGADISNYIRAFDGISGSVTHQDAVGAELSLLIQFDALYSQVGLGSIGAIQLVPQVGEHVCSDESIMDKLLGKVEGARGDVKEGSGIILVSGRFEKVGEEFFLVTRVEFRRKGTEELILIRDRGGSPSSGLIGALPRNDITFSPRRLNRKQIQNITRAYERYIKVRRERSETSPGERIDALGERGAAFAIKGVSDGWLEIEWYQSGETGYVEVPDSVGGLRLRQMMPELYFVNAAAVYLSLVVRGREVRDNAYRRRVKQFDELRGAFARHASGRSDGEALALLDAMSGVLLMARAGSEAEVTAAAKRFASAAKGLPASSNALLLDVLGQHARDSWKQGQRPDSLAAADEMVVRRLARIIAIDPRNATAKLNFAAKVTQNPVLQTREYKRLRESIEADEKLKDKKSAFDELRSRGNG